MMAAAESAVYYPHHEGGRGSPMRIHDVAGKSAVPGSNLASPQLTADCQSPGGLPPGIALGCKLTSVRGDRGENYQKIPKNI